MASSPSTPPFSHLLVTNWDFPPEHHTRLSSYFTSITHVPLGGTPTDAQLAEADVIFGLPRATYIRSIHQVPKLRFIQLGSAGSDGIIGSPMWEEQESEREQENWVKLASCSGVHVGAIGQVCKDRTTRAIRAELCAVFHNDNVGVVSSSPGAGTYQPSMPRSTSVLSFLSR